MTNLNEKQPTTTDLTTNDWADFWHYTIGVNVIPADTKNKVTYVKWSTWQDKPFEFID